jgi:arginase
MELGMLTGHAPGVPFTAEAPRLAAEAVTILGHRPANLSPEAALENSRIDPGIPALTAPEIRAHGPGRVGAEEAARFAGRPAWLHLDLDVLDADVLPAVTYPQAEGLEWDELIALARPLAAAATLLGISLADFNPDRDPDGTHAKRVVAGLARILSARAAAG